MSITRRMSPSTLRTAVYKIIKKNKKEKCGRKGSLFDQRLSLWTHRFWGFVGRRPFFIIQHIWSCYSVSYIISTYNATERNCLPIRVFNVTISYWPLLFLQLGISAIAVLILILILTLPIRLVCGRALYIFIYTCVNCCCVLQGPIGLDGQRGFTVKHHTTKLLCYPKIHLIIAR